MIGLKNTALLLSFITLYACNHKPSGVTGWDYNNNKTPTLEMKKYKGQETGPGLVFIEGGTFTMGQSEQDVSYEWNNIPRRITVPSFFMDEFEVTNFSYLEYLYWTNRVFGFDYPEVYKKALPDTLCWREPTAYNEPYVDYYLRHPAYRQYPVVGVSWLQANDFCNWRTDRVNEFILIREGLLDHNVNPTSTDYFSTEAYLSGVWQGQFTQKLATKNKGQRDVEMRDGILLPSYRLPTEAEWEYAAYGLIGNTVGERIKDKRKYPWDGNGVRSSDPKNIGQMQANFVRGSGDYMGVAGSLNDAADITAPVYSYAPNDFGLYNMAGNVSEWVMDVYRPLTSEEADEFNAFRGNNFKTKQVDPATGQIVQNTGAPMYETFENTLSPASPKGVVSTVKVRKDSNLIVVPGQVVWREVSIDNPIDNLDERRNYKTNDYKDTKDGDVNSSIYYTEGENAYSNHPNKLMYEYAQTSMINNKARVYKGGSWRDRASYLNPGNRRFLDERQSKSSIGFRCAMSKVGSPVGLGK